MTNPILPTKICKKCGLEYPRTREFFYRSNKVRDGFQSRCISCERNVDPETKARRYKASREWAIAHPEKIREYRETYEKRHPEPRSPEKRREDSRKHREKYKEELKKKRHDAYQANPEKFAERNRKWRAAHPDHFKALLRNRRALKKGAEGSFTAEDIEKAYALQKGRCWWCSKKIKGKYDIDHRVPLSKGGSNNPSNLVISCPHCNRTKHDKMPDEFAGRLL